MKKPLLAGFAALAPGGAGAAHALPLSSATGHALSGDGMSLGVIEDFDALSAGVSVALTGGGGAIGLHAITCRPQTRRIYGFRTADDPVRRVDAAPGMSTRVATSLPTRSSASTSKNFLDAAHREHPRPEPGVLPREYAARHPGCRAGDHAALLRGRRRERADPDTCTNAAPDASTTLGSSSTAIRTRRRPSPTTRAA